jgi:hypothetical protein
MAVARGCLRRLPLPPVGRLFWPPAEGNDAGLLYSCQLDGSGWLAVLPELRRRLKAAEAASGAILIAVRPARVGFASPTVAGVLHT